GWTVSLREALLAANQTVSGAGIDPAATDRIRFQFASGTTQTITLASGAALPAIVAPVDLDGGAAIGGAPAIVIDGSNVGGTADGLVLAPGDDGTPPSVIGAAGSRIAGISIVGFGGSGIVVGASSVTVENTWIGGSAVGPDGEIAGTGNGGRGIVVSDAAGKPVTATLLRNNVIANNALAGIEVQGAGVSGTRILGNRIEANGNGSPTDATQRAGILLGGGVSNVGVGIDPTTGAVLGNMIAGNGTAGVRALAGSGGHSIVGNAISGAAAVIDLQGTGRPVAPTLRWAQPGPVDGVNDYASGTTQVAVSLPGRAGEVWRIDFYVDTTRYTAVPTVATSATGWTAAGSRYFTFTQDRTGTATWIPPLALQQGMAVTATATLVSSSDPARSAPIGATSAMSRPVVVALAPAGSPLSFEVSESVDPGAKGPVPIGRIVFDRQGDAPIVAWAVRNDSGNQFSIDGTGLLSFRAPPDAEGVGGVGPRTLTVRATNAFGGFVDLAVTVRVTDLNDQRPTLALPTSLTGLEDGAILLSDAKALSVGDSDATAANARVTVSFGVDLGTLSLSGPPRAGVSVEVSNGGLGLSLAGAPADVTDAMKRVAFAAPGNWNGTAVLRVQAVDGGGLSASGTVQLVVAPVNDAPQVEVATGVSGLIGRDLAVGAGILAVRDVDPNDTPAAITYTVAQASASGALRLGGRTLANGDSFTQADVDAGRLSFLGSREGASSLVLTVRDAAGAAPGGGAITLTLKLSSPPVSAQAGSTSSPSLQASRQADSAAPSPVLGESATTPATVQASAPGASTGSGGAAGDGGSAAATAQARAGASGVAADRSGSG
ncbi:MAG: cadherin-like domain-containing protein, partial [Burkholderiales bacterium]